MLLKEQDLLKPAAAIGLAESGEMAGAEELEQLGISPAWQEVFTEVQEQLKSVNAVAPPGTAHAFAAVPILREDDLLGLIEVDNHRSGHSIRDSNLRTLESFALQAAVAINDAQVRQDPSAWKDQLDEVLELGQELQDIEQFEDLARELDEEASET